MLPGQIIAGQLLQGGTSLATATPVPTAGSNSSSSSIPLDSPDRSCTARTLGHSPSLQAELGFPPGRAVVYAHRRSGAVSEAAMRACCAPSALRAADAFCVLWCEIPDAYVAQMRTADGEYVTAPFVGCLERVYFAQVEKGKEGGNGTAGVLTVQDEENADEVFGPVAVRPAEETSEAALRTGRGWRGRVLGMAVLALLGPWLLAVG
ncbi:hypothetical protein F4775DRAFT_597708 [Biscogniauxia sp. FL1348]|nr:hypothetical protein F4775DRAFT_597708 [Biscogniauxia sp. FL1348]